MRNLLGPPVPWQSHARVGEWDGLATTLQVVGHPARACRAARAGSLLGPPFKVVSWPVTLLLSMAVRWVGRSRFRFTQTGATQWL